MCQQENEGYVGYTCAMCGTQDTEELGDGNTECLACGFVFSPENSGMTRTDVVWEVDRLLGLAPEVQDEWTKNIEQTLQRMMAVVPAQTTT